MESGGVLFWEYWERWRDTAAPRCFYAFGKLRWFAWDFEGHLPRVTESICFTITPRIVSQNKSQTRQKSHKIPAKTMYFEAKSAPECHLGPFRAKVCPNGLPEPKKLRFWGRFGLPFGTKNQENAVVFQAVFLMWFLQLFFMPPGLHFKVFWRHFLRLF